MTVLDDALTGTDSTTLSSVATTPDSTCYFSACYNRNEAWPRQRFFVRPVSCVVQLPYTSTSNLIAPATSGDRSISTALEFNHIVSNAPTIQMKPPLLMSLDNQGSYGRPSPSTSATVSDDRIPSYTDITTSHVDMTASYLDIIPSNLEITTTNLKIKCIFFWCIPGYVTMSILATITFGLLLLIAAMVGRFIIWQKMALKRYMQYVLLLICIPSLLSAQGTRPPLIRMHE